MHRVEPLRFVRPRPPIIGPCSDSKEAVASTLLEEGLLQGRQFITCKFAFLRSEKSRNEGEEVGDNLDPLKPS